MKENFYTYFTNCLNVDKLPHAFFIETDDVELEFQKIISYLHEKELIKNVNYINNINLIIIEPDGKEIKSDAIANLQKKFMTTPTDDIYNIYIIKNVEKLNLSSSNKILKFLEEPSNNIIGILIASDSNVISTIKSRSQIFKIINNKKEFNKSHEIEVFQNFIKKLEIREQLYFKHTFSKLERVEFINICYDLISYYEDFINNNLNDIKTVKNYSRLILILENTLRLLKSNVNIDLVIDKLCIEVIG